MIEKLIELIEENQGNYICRDFDCRNVEFNCNECPLNMNNENMSILLKELQELKND